MESVNVVIVQSSEYILLYINGFFQRSIKIVPDKDGFADIELLMSASLGNAVEVIRHKFGKSCLIDKVVKTYLAGGKHQQVSLDLDAYIEKWGSFPPNCPINMDDFSSWSACQPDWLHHARQP